MINAEKIEEMKRLSAKATPGPWHAKLVDGWKVDICGKGRFVIEEDESLLGEDVGFIAKSRQFVPDIIAAYEAQAEEIDRLSRRRKISSLQISQLFGEIERLKKVLRTLENHAHDGDFVEHFAREALNYDE